LNHSHLSVVDDFAPLVVDLDGTLIHSDVLHELLLLLVRENPLLLFSAICWLLKGKVYFKKQLSKNVSLCINLLPYNQELLQYLRCQRALGQRLILCTASDMSVAISIADHLGIFDDVIATSDTTLNLAGKNKANMLVERYGPKAFDYIGNSHVDLPVWGKARTAVVVNGSSRLIFKVEKMVQIKKIIKPSSSFKEWVHAIRIRQYIKNLLIFVPMFTSHQTINQDFLESLLLAFASFSLCASSVYIANDLLDLESDRRHPSKRFRPFASGNLPIWQGVLVAIILITASLTMAFHVNDYFFLWLAIYFFLTCCYSLYLKRLALVDCLILAILYTLRIVAGAYAVNIPLSFWLLAFSIFLFLSLAFLKRFAELRLHQNSAIDKAHGRGYYMGDASLIQQLGVTSGYSATLVLALYLNSENVIRLYQTPEIIWAAIPLILLWVSWMWLKADRGLMQDDPIVFATKDTTSIFIGACFITVFLLARIL